jgi:hypothetical protein
MAPSLGGCKPREAGGRSEQTSEQLLPTLTTESTAIDAGVDPLRGVRIPFRST